MMKVMPYKLDVASWTTLVGAYKIHGNVEMVDLLLNKFLNWSVKIM
jgi:hypothetical protein